MSENEDKAKSIFLDAAEIASDAERAAYVVERCGGDRALRSEVEDLLRHRADLSGFMPAAAGSAGDTPSQAALPLREGPGTMIGPYKLLQQIGEGGMGVVFLAEQTRPVHRQVALKVIKAGMDTRQVVARFESERQALALMDHPNIAKVFDAGTTDTGRPYFVMELVKGVPMTKYCDQHKLSPRDRLELFIQVCQAVQHAHQKGIIHRDLKPTNVLVAQYDGKPVPKVIDFGVAKATGRKLTERTMFTGFGDVIGTLEYMSPEQAEMNQLDVDTRSDIYSLGVLLYELLTGSTPLEKERIKQTALLEALRFVREEEAPRPSTRLNTAEQLPSIAANRGLEPKKLSGLVQGELDWIVMRALEKDRSRRYETASAMVNDVQRYLSDEPVQACPPSATYRFRKFVRRNKGPMTAASLILTALLVGVIGTTVGLLRAQAAGRAAIEQRRVAEANEKKALAAAAAEKDAKQTAQAREAETQAILEFVQSKVFAAAGPQGEQGGLGREVTLRKAIDASIPFIENSFRDRPFIEARLRSTVGIALFNLGELGRAAEQFQKARALYERSAGPRHLATLKSMGNLANCYSCLNREPEALRLREERLAMMKTELGPDDRETLVAMSDLADSYERTDRNLDALRLGEQTLALQKEKIGPDHHDTLMTMTNLANTYQKLRRHKDAMNLREQTLAAQKAHLGPNHRLTLTSMNNLALSYSDLDRHADARALLADAMALQETHLGAAHADTLRSMSNLAKELRALGREPEAFAVAGECLKRAEGSDAETNTLEQVLEIRLRHFQRMKDSSGCRASAEAFEKLPLTDGGRLYDAACTRAVTAAVIELDPKVPAAGVARLSREEADRAMALLKRAVAAGFDDIGHVKTRDDDLRVLRGRADFAALVAEMERKASAANAKPTTKPQSKQR